jgi:hypothetical protein
LRARFALALAEMEMVHRMMKTWPGAAALVVAFVAGPVCAQSPVVPPNLPKPQRVYPPPTTPAVPDSRPGEKPSKPAEPTNTTIHIDLFSSDPTQALQSQTWGRVFDTLGHRVRIRTGGAEDEPQISESNRGPLRTVTLVGKIDRRGTVTFPGRTFNPGDDKALKEWLEELQSYGAQGSPIGKPRWGLNADQFQGLFTSLSEVVETDVTGLPLPDVVRSFGFGIDIPLRIHDSVADRWKSTASGLVALQDVRKLTRGSALAVLLNDHGLCFRPLRTPSGAIDLVVLDKAQTADPWPLGWEPRPNVPRNEYAPALFAFGPIGFLDRPVTETLADAREQTGCAMVVDTPGLLKKEVDLSKKIYGVPQKKTAWVLILQSALTGTGLLPHIRIDEAGRGFVLVAPFESKSVSR